MSAKKYIFLSLFVSFAIPLSVGAQQGQKEQRAKREASRFFSRGELLFDAGNYSKAAEAFSLAYETYPHPATLVNIGLCYEKAGWLPLAVETYRQYVSLAAGAPDEGAIQKKIKKLLKSVGELIITCATGGEECVIQVAGVDRGKAPVTVLVEPGRRNVTAYVDGAEVYASTIAIDAGERREMEITPSYQPAEPSPASAKSDADVAAPDAALLAPERDLAGVPAAGDSDNSDPEETHVSLSPAFWVSMGVTVAAGAMTIVFGVRFLKDRERFEASGKTDLSASADGRRDKLATNILIGVTSAAGVVALSFAIRDIWFSSKKDAAKTNVTLGPGLGLGLTRHF